MEETFAWMLHEAWPSSRGALKMMVSPLPLHQSLESSSISPGRL